MPEDADAGAGTDRAAGAAPKRNPHEPQKTLLGALICPHCGHGEPPEGAVEGDTATGAMGGGGVAVGTDAICAVGPCPSEGAEPGSAGTRTEAALTPCGGVDAEKVLGAVSRGSSAPQPRQNL